MPAPYFRFKPLRPPPYYPPVRASEIPVPPERRLPEYESDDELFMMHTYSQSSRRRRKSRSKHRHRSMAYLHSPPPSDEELETSIRNERRMRHDSDMQRLEEERERQLRGMSDREYGYRDRGGYREREGYRERDGYREPDGYREREEGREPYRYQVYDHRDEGHDRRDERGYDERGYYDRSERGRGDRDYRDGYGGRDRRDSGDERGYGGRDYPDRYAEQGGREGRDGYGERERRTSREGELRRDWDKEYEDQRYASRDRQEYGRQGVPYGGQPQFQPAPAPPPPALQPLAPTVGLTGKQQVGAVKYAYPEPVPEGTFPRMTPAGTPGAAPGMPMPGTGPAPMGQGGYADAGMAAGIGAGIGAGMAAGMAAGMGGQGHQMGMHGEDLMSEELDSEERYQALMRQRRHRRRRHRHGRRRRRRRRKKTYEDEGYPIDDEEEYEEEELEAEGKAGEDGDNNNEQQSGGQGGGFNVTKRGLFKGAVVTAAGLGVAYGIKKFMERRQRKKEEEQAKLSGTLGSHGGDMEYHEGNYPPPIPKAGMFSVVIPENHVGIVERGGKYHRKLGAGSNSLISCMDTVKYCHTLKEMNMPLPPQTCYTNDNVPMNTNALLFAKIEDPVRASYDVDDPYRAIVLLAQTLLRNEISSMTVASVLENRNVITDRVLRQTNVACRPWGMRCVRFELHGLEPPPDFKDSMEREAEAERQRRFQVLQSEAEREAAINRADGEFQAQVKRSQARQIEALNQAIGEAHAITEKGEAIANAMREVAQVVKEPGGEQAMQMRITEQYINAYRNASRAPVVPAPDPENVAESLNNAMGLINTLGDNSAKMPIPVPDMPPNPFAGPSNDPNAPVPTVYPEELDSMPDEHTVPSTVHSRPIVQHVTEELTYPVKDNSAARRFQNGHPLKYPQADKSKPNSRNRSVKTLSQQSTPKSKPSLTRSILSDRVRNLSPSQGGSSDRTRRSDRTGRSDRTKRSDRTRDSDRSRRSSRSRRSERTRRSGTPRLGSSQGSSRREL